MDPCCFAIPYTHFLDDLTLSGSVTAVARNVSTVVDVGKDLGLELNVSKCELIAHDSLTVMDSFLQSFSRVKIAEAVLLGAPLFPGPALRLSTSRKI